MNDNEKEKIDHFFAEYRFLSNFWLSKVTLDGVQYDTVEHAYQAAKTYNAQDRLKIKNCPSPALAKKAGYKVVLRPDWDEVKVDIMKSLVRQKFFAHKGLRNSLVDTGDAELIEGNGWDDTFWGVCNGKGENNLGKILMAVRDELNKLTEEA